MREACDRLGGENSDLSVSVAQPEKRSKPVQPSTTTILPPAPEEKQSRPHEKSYGSSDEGYVKVGKEERILERRRMGFAG